MKITVAKSGENLTVSNFVKSKSSLFCSLTCHRISEDWKLMSYVIDEREFSGHHTADLLGESICSILELAIGRSLISCCQLDPRFHKLPFLKAAARAKNCALQFTKPLTKNETISVNQVTGATVVEENTEDTRPGISADLLSVMYRPKIVQARQQLSKRKNPSKMNLWHTWKKHRYHETTVRWSGGSWSR